MTYPPLVEPGPPLDAGETIRYTRQLGLNDLGELGQRRLAAARVAVVGAGGLGSPVLTYLAAAGVGTLGVVDDDVVDPTNLQRQVLYAADQVGTPKADRAAERLTGINPNLTVTAHRTRMALSNGADLLRGYHLVMDCSDNFPTRYLIDDTCARFGTPNVSGAVSGFFGQVSVFWEGHGPRYRDLYPNPPDQSSQGAEPDPGPLGAVCAMVGAVMVTEAVKLVTGIGRPLVGELLTVDALDMRWRSVPLGPL